MLRNKVCIWGQMRLPGPLQGPRQLIKFATENSKDFKFVFILLTFSKFSTMNYRSFEILSQLGKRNLNCLRKVKSLMLTTFLHKHLRSVCDTLQISARTSLLVSGPQDFTTHKWTERWTFFPCKLWNCYIRYYLGEGIGQQ